MYYPCKAVINLFGKEEGRIKGGGRPLAPSFAVFGHFLSQESDVKNEPSSQKKTLLVWEKPFFTKAGRKMLFF
jgi:hypothetical protein